MVVTTDIAAIFISYLAAYYTRFSGILVPVYKGIPHVGEYLRPLIFLVPIYIYFFRSYNLYHPERNIRRIYELLNTVKAVSAAAVLCMALTFIYRNFEYSRLTLFLAWIFSTFLCVLARYCMIQIEYSIKRHKDRSRVLIVGLNRSSRNLIRWSREHKHYGQDVIGLIAINGGGEQGKHFEGVPIIGTVLDFNRIMETQSIDEVIVADPTLPRETVSTLMMKCEDKLINFKLVADFYGLLTHHVDVEYLSNLPLLGVRDLPLDDPWNQWMKRLFDIFVSLIGLILASPLLFSIAIAIKVFDKGPILYKQKRVGRDEKVFTFYKFTTMRPDAEKKTGPVWAQPHDPRTTGMGRLIRKWNLDELPQLWNVLRGDMSLVGPRPERPHFVEKFRSQIPRYMARHKIKCGITGWAQIHGLRGNTSLEERIKYDIYYMENWTFTMDIEILFITLFAYKNAY